MALVLADRVQETGTANTTVSFTLGGAVVGFQSFAVIGNGNTAYYSAFDTSGNWEVGIGTYSTTGPTLTRTTILSSSNSGSAVTFSGGVNVFVTYPSEKSVNLSAAGNVSPLGTVSSGTWQGSTVGVAYGGTGVTASSGANSVVLRDANQNVDANNFIASLNTVVSAAGTTVLVVSSSYHQRLTGTTTQTFQLPDATTLINGTTFLFDNDSTGILTITDNAATVLDTIATGGNAYIYLSSNTLPAGAWNAHAFLPSNYNFNSVTANFGTADLTNGTWQGNTVGTPYGGTGLTSFTSGGAVYATSTSALTSGTLPVGSGGTGATNTPTNGQLLIGNGTGYTVATLTPGTGISVTDGAGSITIANTGLSTYPGSGIPNSTGSSWGTSYSTSGTGSVVALASGATLGAPQFTAYQETVTTVGTVSGTTYNIDLSLSNIFDITLGNNVTFTFTNPPASGVSKSATIILRQDATGSRLATFTNAKYTDGVLPILSTGANQVDVLTFFTLNGGSFWFGTFAMANVS
jgi:hypothetical protein